MGGPPQYVQPRRSILQLAHIMVGVRNIQEFADAVMQLEAGLWHGPVPSGYGLHLVYVSEYMAAQDPILADVRDKVLMEYQREQTKKFNEDYLDVLRERYTITIEEPIEGADDFEALESSP